MPHKWVIAGTREEYKSWLRKRPEALHGEYAYLADVIMLKGYTDPKGIFIGTWVQRSDIDSILNQLLIASHGVRSEGLMRALAIREKSMTPEAFASHVSASEYWQRERNIKLSKIAEEMGVLAKAMPELPKEFFMKVNGGMNET